MYKHLSKVFSLLVGLLAIALFALAALPVSAQNTTTKIVFVRTGADSTLVEYKSFLQNTVYPGQTILYNGTQTANAFNGTLTATQIALLTDADLIIVTDMAQYWTNTYTDPLWKSLQVPIILHHPYQGRDWGWYEAYNNVTLSHGPIPGTSLGYLVKPQALNAATEPFYTKNNLGASLGLVPDGGATPDPTYQWIQLFNGNQQQIALNYGNRGQGIALASASKGSYQGTIDGNNGAGYTANIIRWTQGATMQSGVAGGRRFFYNWTDFTVSNGFTSQFFNTNATALGKTALQNALLMMYDPQYGRRPVITATAPAVIATHSGAANQMVPVTGVTVTNGGTPEPVTISWSVSPAAGYDAAGSTNLNTQAPTFHFTADGTYTATVTAQKPNLDYVTATKTIIVVQVGANPVVQSVTPTAGTTFKVNFPNTVNITFDQPITQGTILVNGVPVTGPVGGTVANNGVQTQTWTIPPAAMPNMPGPVTISLDQTTVLPAMVTPPNLYTWTVNYNRAAYQPIVAMVSNTDSSDDHSAYTSFLINTAYPTTAYTRAIQIEDIRGKYYGLTAAAREQMEANLSLVVVLPFQTSSQLNAAAQVAQWNTLKVPVMNNKSGIAANWNWSNGTANAGVVTGGQGFADGWLGVTEPTWSKLVLVTAGTDSDALYQGLPRPNAGDAYGPQAAYGSARLWIAPWGADANALVYFSTIIQVNGINAGNMNRDTVPVAGGVGEHYAGTWGGSAALARWEQGSLLYNSAPAPARAVFQGMGPQLVGDNYGSGEVATFFGPNGAYTDGAQMVLRNGFRYLFSPDTIPNVVTVTSANPASGVNSGVYRMPITVNFSQPVSGVLPSDLTWNASTSAVTYHATSAIPAGSSPNVTWIFDGAWETDLSETNVYQPINITLNGQDNAARSHIVAATGEGVPQAQWTWNYVWAAAPASVSEKMWTLYE